MFVLRVFVIPHDSAASLLDAGSINVVTVFLHQLFQDFEPALRGHLEQRRPLTVDAVLVTTLSAQPKVGNSIEYLLDIRS